MTDVRWKHYIIDVYHMYVYIEQLKRLFEHYLYRAE